MDGRSDIRGYVGRSGILTHVAKEEAVKSTGTVVNVLPNTMFRIQVESGPVVLGHISGKMRKHFIKLVVGDRVAIEMSPYDTSKARITRRL
jgi:translation initiation factor IF-1